MLIGITGAPGSGKGVAADFLAQRIHGAVVVPMADAGDVLAQYTPGAVVTCAAGAAPVTIIPDVTSDTDAARIREHGRVVHVYGRSDGEHATVGDTDWLVGNTSSVPEFYAALVTVAAEIARRVST